MPDLPAALQAGAYERAAARYADARAALMRARHVVELDAAGDDTGKAGS